MTTFRGCIPAKKSALLVVWLTLWIPCFPRSEKPAPAAQVTVRAAREGCAVDLDSTAVGKTDARGVLALTGVEPGDHYIHVRCENTPESSYFISPAEGQKIETSPDSSLQKEAASAGASPDFRGKPIELREHIQRAVQLRARGRIEEAVQHLRDASKLDPENADLHCELGITFLLGKDWKRARVEMLEALRHDPTNADAHNGLGYALEKLGRLDDALKEYRTASKLDPDDPSYRQHYIDALGKVYAQQAEKKK
jgi:cytochrome c-type biogenesis protein CcmH/NrfG